MKYIYGKRIKTFKDRVTTLIASLAILANSAGVALPVLLTQKVAAAPYGDVVVRPSSLHGWNSTNASGGINNFVSDSTAPFGVGALELDTTSSNLSRARREKSVSPNLQLSSLTSLSYFTKHVEGPAHAAVALQITINGLSGVSSFNSTTLVYEPYWNGTVDTSGEWQNWDTLSGGKFWSTNSVAGFVNGSGGAPFYTIEQVKATHPNAKITSIKLNIGTYNPDWVVRTDGVNLNGTVFDFEQNALPAVNGQNFNTHSGSDYKGLNVGFDIANFGIVTEVEVSLYKNSEVLVSNTHNSNLLNLINSGTSNLSTPFIIQNGTYVEEYWNLGNFDWGMGTKPTKAVVTVTGSNGTASTELLNLSEATASYVSLLPYIYPSTNDENRTNGDPHVNLLSANHQEIVLQFVNPRNYMTCFEYRTDGDTTQALATANPNSAVSDLYPSLCLTNETTNHTFYPDQYVEVRSTFGAERDHDFNWTRFDLVPDTIQPVIEFITPVANSTVSGIVNIQARIIEEGSGLDYAWVKFVDGTDPNQFGAIQMQLVPGETDIYEAQIDTSVYNGLYALGIDVADNAGNGRSAKAQNITVDNTAPIINNIKMFVNGTEKKIAKSGDTISITVDAIDSASDIEKVQIWVRDWPYTGRQLIAGNMAHVSGTTYEYIFTLPATYSDGTPINQTFNGNYFNFRPYDIAGNSQIGWRTNFTADNTRPAITVNTPNNSINPTVLSVTAIDNIQLGQVTGHVYNDSNTTLVKNCSINVSALNVTAYTHTCNITTMGLADGIYTIRANARDHADLLSYTNSDAQFIIDFSAPQIDIADIAISTDKKLSFELEANEVGPSGLKIVAANIYNAANTGSPVIVLGTGNPSRLNPTHSGLPIGTQTFSTTIENIDVSSLASGTYTIRAYANDHAGNELRFKTVQFTVDNTAPNVSVNDITAINVGNNAVVTGTIDDPSVSSVEILVDSVLKGTAVVTAGAFSFDVSGLGVGNHNITVRATDDAGNVGEDTKSVSVGAVESAFTNTPGGSEEAPNINTASTSRNPSTTSNVTITDNNSGGDTLVEQTADEPEAQVLQATDNSESAQNTANESDDSEDANGCGKFLGLCWYLWIPIVIAVLGTIYYVSSRRTDEK